MWKDSCIAMNLEVCHGANINKEQMQSAALQTQQSVLCICTHRMATWESLLYGAGAWHCSKILWVLLWPMLYLFTAFHGSNSFVQSCLQKDKPSKQNPKLHGKVNEHVLKTAKKWTQREILINIKLTVSRRSSVERMVQRVALFH